MAVQTNKIHQIIHSLMLRNLIIIASIAAASSVAANDANSFLNITPAPAKIEWGEGLFFTPRYIVYTISGPNEDTERLGAYLAGKDRRYSAGNSGIVRLEITDTVDGGVCLFQ